MTFLCSVEDEKYSSRSSYRKYNFSSCSFAKKIPLSHTCSIMTLDTPLSQNLYLYVPLQSTYFTELKFRPHSHDFCFPQCVSEFPPVWISQIFSMKSDKNYRFLMEVNKWKINNDSTTFFELVASKNSF